MGRLLDEDTVIKVLERWQKAFRENSHYVSASDLSLVVKDVRELPTIQPETHEGKFERKLDGVFCSVCHYGWEFITGVPAEVEREYHYCPNCGADMIGEQDG